MSMIELSSVSLGYKNHSVLEDVSFELEEGTSVAIVGKTGSGKSTLAAILATLLRPDSGELHILGQDVRYLKGRSLAELRRHQIGVVFQAAELIPTMTAVENVAFPAMLAGASWSGAEERARRLLDDLEMTQPDSPASTLSGGEAQRVALCRALINRPRIIIADEPTASLDGETKEIVGKLLFEECESRASGLVVVTHDERTARRADRILHIVDGHLLERSEVRQ